VSGRVLLFGGSPHEEAQRLLPWLVNGQLDPDEASWLSSHVDSCDECRLEIHALRTLQALYLEAPAATGDADAGWKRMRVQLDASRSPSPAKARLTAWWHARPRWQPLLLAAQAALIMVLALALWRAPDATQPAQYRTLGAATPPGQLVVVFDGNVREARLRALLQATGARIVDGPSMAGAYTLAVPPTRAASVHDALQASPDVVLVERLDAGAAR
jgi:anti-sigma-K factor RskA